MKGTGSKAISNLFGKENAIYVGNSHVHVDMKPAGYSVFQITYTNLDIPGEHNFWVNLLKGRRKGGINLSRLICACVVMAGLFITVEPQIWGLDGSSDNTETKSIAYRILWPLCFAMGFLPYGIMNVICEKELKKGESHSFSFITWTQIFQVVTMVMMFWADFIPQFGMASSPQNFIERLKNGIHCSYSSEAACGGLAWEAWLFYICYCLGNLFNFLLIQYAEGAVYAAVVQAVVSPIAALFWSLFVFDEENLLFFWKPTFNETTAYTIGGLCLMVPGVVLYNYFSYSEEKKKTDTESLL